MTISKIANVGIPKTPSPLELANVANLDPPSPSPLKTADVLYERPLSPLKLSRHTNNRSSSE